MRDRLAPFLLPAVVVAGGLLAVQGRINGELGIQVGSSVLAALVSFAVGTVLFAVLVATRHVAGLKRLLRSRGEWWWWLGGLAGAAVVASTAQGVPQLGVALVSVCIVAGTAVGALAVDELGLGPGGRQQVTVFRLVGAGVAVGAVALGAVGGRHGQFRPVLIAVLATAGAASAWQQAANGQLRRTATSTPVASLVSFSGGTAGLLVLAAVRGDLTIPSWPGSWWLYLGGLLGSLYIALAAVSVSRLGVLRLSLATVAGQLAGAVLLDLVWPAPGTQLHVTTAIGAALTLVAVAISGMRRTTVHA